MTAILGFADILSANANNSADIDAINTISRNGEYLLQIINDILDLSKIEAGRFEVDRRSCSIPQIVADVVSLMQVRAAAKKLTLDVDYEGPIPETIQTDPVRLRQILVNLLGNAVKFTVSGSVRLRVGLAANQHEPARMQFTVIDSGIGMTEEDMSHLFQPFSQGHSSVNQVNGGTGLGLAISKRLAVILGGDITATSAFRRGSTFTLTIDPGPLNGIRMLTHPDQAIEHYKPEFSKSEKPKIAICGRILLAEDGPDNQRLISYMLKEAGAEVTIAENGQVAIEKALSLCTGEKPFDLILMDMQMPVLNGYEATKKLRDLGYRGPIIAITAHAMTEDRQKCIDAGCTDYITKPIIQNHFLSLISKYMRNGKQEEKTVAAAT